MDSFQEVEDDHQNIAAAYTGVLAGVPEVLAGAVWRALCLPQMS